MNISYFLDPCYLNPILRDHAKEVGQVWNLTNGSYEYKLKADNTEPSDGCEYKVFNFNDEAHPIPNAYAKYDKTRGILQLSNVNNDTAYKLTPVGKKEFSEFYLTTNTTEEPVTRIIPYCEKTKKNLTINMTTHFSNYLLISRSELIVNNGYPVKDFSHTHILKDENRDFTMTRRSNETILDLYPGEQFLYDKDLELEARLNFRQKSHINIKFIRACT